MKIKVGIAGLLTALALSTGGPGGAPAADAASGVVYCFRYAPNLGGYAVTQSRRPLRVEHAVLQAYYSDGWRAVPYGGTNSSGYGSFITGSVSDRYVRVSYVAQIGGALV